MYALAWSGASDSEAALVGALDRALAYCAARRPGLPCALMMLHALVLTLACSGKGADTSRPPGPPDGTDSALTDSGDTEEPWTPPPECLDPDPEASGEPALIVTGERPRNLLMISVDTLNVFRTGRYGGTDNTPTLDRLLSEGLVLDNHSTCSNWTFPSVLCATTAAYPLSNGFMPSVYGGKPEPAPPGLRSATDWMREAGYLTGLISANFYLSSEFRSTSPDYETVDQGFPANLIFEITGEDVLSQLLEASEVKGQPWYMHYHAIDPHAPYEPPDESYFDEYEALPEYKFDLRTDEGLAAMRSAWPALDAEQRQEAITYLNAIYDAEVRYFDDWLGVLLENLDGVGALDDTLVVLWSDHGEQLMDHGQLGHGYDLYDTETRGMAAFWMKDGGVQAGSWTGPTDQRDLVPTAFEALGLPQQEGWEGRVVGTASPERNRYGLQLKDVDSKQSVRRGDLKMIFDWGEKPRVYNMVEDPEEKVNLYDVKNEDHKCLWVGLELQLDELLAIYPDYEDLAVVP